MSILLDDLRESNEFLNAVIDNINSAIFVLDQEIRVHQFNHSFQQLFDKSEEALMGQLCGNAIGCAFAVREDNPCGQTSHCGMCELRASLLKTITEHVPTYKVSFRQPRVSGKKPTMQAKKSRGEEDRA